MQENTFPNKTNTEPKHQNNIQGITNANKKINIDNGA